MNPLPNFNQAFKEEVARLARKEIKDELAQLAKRGAIHRRDIAELKREVSALNRRIAFLENREKKRLGKPEAEAADKQARFSPKWLARHREKLGLSAADYGKLVGASGQSIYFWEQGKTSPRKAQVEKLAAVRGIGPREAQRRLSLLD